MSNIKIINDVENLTSSEQFLVDFINKNPEIFINQTTSEISKKANVSASALTRLSKKLNYPNLKSLQIMVANKHHEIQKNFVLQHEGNLQQNLKNLKKFNTYLFKEILDHLNLEILENLINKILNTKKILIFGKDLNFIPAYSLALNFEKIGYSIITDLDFKRLLINLPKLKQNDLVIIFSSNLISSEVNFLIQKCFELQIPVALITSNANFIQKSKIKYLLDFPPIELNPEFLDTNEKNSQLIISEIIYFEVFNKHHFNKKTVQKTNELLNE
jgi:DNA-binding MurR/RpiR family transcriptional regulator